MILTILLALQVATAPTIADDGTITVTSTYLPDLADAEALCRKARCPLRQDVAATVAYASKLFDEGSYARGKQALVAGIARVKQRAGEAPLVVAQLYAATAKLSEHEGDQDLTRLAYEGGLSVLRRFQSPDDATRLATEVRYGDWLLTQLDPRGAKARYRAASAGGDPAIRAAAQLRLARLLAAENARGEADVILVQLAGNDDPYTRQAALAMRQRLARRSGNKAIAAAAAAGLAAAPTDVPRLVSAPPFPRPGQLVDPRRSADPLWGGAQFTDGFGGSTVALSWVDVAYCIRPDGSVDDVKVVRSSSSSAWAAPILAYLGARRYTATVHGRQRVERYTLTADYDRRIGSLIRRRSVAPHYVMAEVSDAPLG